MLVSMYGVIVMLDVLGVKKFSINECSIFLNKIRNELETGLTQHATVFEDSRQIALFSDTIVICYPLNESSIPDIKKIFDLSYELPYIVHWGIQNKYLFRGCVSVGEYLFEDLKYGNCVLGPAMFEASEWYENADWFGIILTPTAGKWVERIIHTEEIAGHDLTEIKKRIYKFKVPLKQKCLKNKINVKEDRIWTIAWPWWYFTQKPNRNTAPYDIFLEDLGKIKRPAEAEQKYQNSIQYFYSYANDLENRE